jgi:hypothetical protein
MTIHSNFQTDFARAEILHDAPPAQSLSVTQARQGATLGRMRFVLGFGLASAIVAFAIIYLIFT